MAIDMLMFQEDFDRYFVYFMTLQTCLSLRLLLDEMSYYR